MAPGAITGRSFCSVLGWAAPRIAPPPRPTHTPQELERALKGTCEGFIMQATKLTVEPLLSFITKVGGVVGAVGWAAAGEATRAAPAG